MSRTATILQILVQIGPVGLLSNQVKYYNAFVTFFDCPILSFFLYFVWLCNPALRLPYTNKFDLIWWFDDDHAPRLNSWADFHVLWLKRRVSAQGGTFGAGRSVTPFRRNMAPNPLKVGVNREIQAKTQKSKNRTMSETVNPIKPKFEDIAAIINYTSWVVYHYPTTNQTWMTAAILKIAKTS